MASN
jgi:hypothetical protein